ncbi:DUF2087 domain-containing protein [Romboutsia weinsteinii]|uniref:DUF2087 domain-containing protein n=1 Tax=Romboutsia weinsteinii TaxID=2020949 RepID=UPI001FB14927|nr:DUF2087 domain-containing protein [Romboutsia weinsteinii]
MSGIADVKNFLDDNNKVKIWPSKRNKKLKVLDYIITRFEDEKIYTEKEVNSIIEDIHTFGDIALIRRELYENKYLARTQNCSEYWVIQKYK